MISQTAEYALRAMVCLGTSTDRPRTTQEIAASIQVSASYLSKILHSLVRAGLVRSQRGPKGGFVIAKGPREITVLDVIESVDPWKRLDRCPLGRPAHAETLCPLHRRLFQAQNMIEEALREAKLEDLIEEVASGSSECFFPAREHPQSRSDPTEPSRKKEEEP